MPSAAEKTLSWRPSFRRCGGRGRDEQRSPTRESSAVQLTGTRRGESPLLVLRDSQGKSRIGGGQGREGHAREGTACAKQCGISEHVSHWLQHGDEGGGPAPSLSPPTAFMRCSVLQGGWGWPKDSWFLPRGAHRFGGAAQQVTLWAQGLWGEVGQSGLREHQGSVDS